jgi:hypothetical protein
MLLASCNDSKEDETDTVDRAGAVETSVSVEHTDSTHDVILTTHRIWVNFKEYKTVTHRDTPYGNYYKGVYQRAGYYSDAFGEEVNIGNNGFKSSIIRGGFGEGAWSVGS